MSDITRTVHARTKYGRRHERKKYNQQEHMRSENTAMSYQYTLVSNCFYKQQKNATCVAIKCQTTHFPTLTREPTDTTVT